MLSEKWLVKKATRLHKSLLGYTGDKSMSFPATLAQNILKECVENPELVVRGAADAADVGDAVCLASC